MTNRADVAEIREALADLPVGSSDGALPEPEHVYFPRSHLKAMDPNCWLVTGINGAGKTFWWSALQLPAVRQMLAHHTTRGTFSDRTEVRIGFGVYPGPSEYPCKGVLRELMGRGVASKLIWRTVLAWQVAPDSHCLRRHDSWPARVEYVRVNSDRVDHLLDARDREFHDEGAYCLILFDALDRCADDWKSTYSAVRGLMQTAAEMRKYRRLRLKLFLRPDQVNRARTADFPDASRVLASAVELSWPRHELYGLLWHSLANGRNGDVLRDFLENGVWQQETIGGLSVHAAPHRLIFDETVQRERFHALSGPVMGREVRRGSPYSWIYDHLSDTRGRVSPGTFLDALRRAAADTANRYPWYGTAFHFDSIKRGVHEASKVRVQELQEDYPWVNQVLNPLRGMIVPCEFNEIGERWQREGVVDGLGRGTVEGKVTLPPRRIDKGPEGILEDLESLGIVMRLQDGRVNIPDLYRAAYGLGRRGGVIRDRSASRWRDRDIGISDEF